MFPIKLLLYNSIFKCDKSIYFYHTSPYSCHGPWWYCKHEPDTTDPILWPNAHHKTLGSRLPCDHDHDGPVQILYWCCSTWHNEYNTKLKSRYVNKDRCKHSIKQSLYMYFSSFIVFLRNIHFVPDCNWLVTAHGCELIPYLKLSLYSIQFYSEFGLDRFHSNNILYLYYVTM